MLDGEKILAVKTQIIDLVKKADCNILESMMAIQFAQLETTQYFVYMDLKDRFMEKEPKK